MVWLSFKRLTRRPKPITTVDEYAGEATIRIAATQFGGEVSERRAREIVDEWCDFFADGCATIEDLEFVTRTPARLFASLRSQTQLRRLCLKWGDYEDLSILGAMSQLQELILRGAQSVKDVSPLAELVTLQTLEIDSVKHAHDLSPLSALVELRSLEVGGDWINFRNAHIDSIGFIAGLSRLERVVLHTIVVDDLDYSPLLEHPDLREARVMEVRGMKPTHDALRSRVRKLQHTRHVDGCRRSIAEVGFELGRGGPTTVTGVPEIAVQTRNVIQVEDYGDLSKVGVELHVNRLGKVWGTP